MLIVDQYHVWTDLLTTLSKKTDFLFIKNWETTNLDYEKLSVVFLYCH